MKILALLPLLALAAAPALATTIEDPRINRTEIPVPDARRALELGRGFFGGDANRFACRDMTSWNQAHGGGWLLWFQDTATGTQRCVRVTSDETVSEPPERGYYRIKRWPAQNAAGAIARVLETQHGVPTAFWIPCPKDGDPARWNVVMLDGETVTSLRIEPDGRVEPANPWLTLHAPPCRYEIGSGDDGGTLSGVARLFYGDATRYNKIFEANRDVLKSPDVVRKGMVLFIPAPAAAPPRKRTSPPNENARVLALYKAFLDDPSERRLLDLLIESFAVDAPSEEYRAFLLGQFSGERPARFKVGLTDADEIDAWTVAYACAERFLLLPFGAGPTRVVAICSRAEGTELWRFHLLRIDPAHLPAIRAALAPAPPRAEDPATSAPAVSTGFAFADSLGADALHYYEGGAPWEHVEDLTLVFPERRVKIDCYRNGDDYRKEQNSTKRRDHVCTDREWRSIVGWLAAARFEGWDELYPSSVCDGTVWSIEFLSGTNVVRRFRGDDNWPKRFYQFRKVKDFAMKLPDEPRTESAEVAED